MNFCLCKVRDCTDTMIEQCYTQSAIGDKDEVVLKQFGISSSDVERILSLTAVLKYLLDYGYIQHNRDPQVLEIGTGSGVGIFAWTTLGIPSEDITAIDTKKGVLPVFSGDAAFIQINANEYLTRLPYHSYDIISAFRIPKGEYNYTRESREGRKEWLHRIYRALKHNGYYVETYSEWVEQDFQSAKDGILSEIHLSFMGDTLVVPELTLCGIKLPGIIRMGYPTGTYEENNWLDGDEWIPADPETGEFKKPQHDFSQFSGSGWYFGPDEYGVWAEQSNTDTFYPFGKRKFIGLEYGYKDNLAVVYHKQK